MEDFCPRWTVSKWPVTIGCGEKHPLGAEVFEVVDEGHVVGGDANVGGGLFAVGAGNGYFKDVAFGDAAGGDIFDEGDKFGVG